MKVIYESNSCLIRKAFFGDKIVVYEKATGTKVTASQSAAARCVLLLEAQEQLTLTVAVRQFVQSYIFERFAGSALNPGSLAASLFVDGDPVRFLSSAVAASDPELVEMLAIGADADSRRLKKELARNGPFHALFADADLCLEYSGGRDQLKVTFIKSGREIIANASQAQRFRDFILAGEVLGGGDLSTEESRLMHRTFARALTCQSDEPLHQIIFGQTAQVAASAVLSAMWQL